MSKTKRAWSTIEIKSFADDGLKRTFEGIASTPETDRQGDIVDPMGAKFTLPISLLWQHDSHMPIGAITDAKATKNGISIKGYVENLSDPPSLKNDLDRAWAMIKSKLVRGLSIGFVPIDMEPVNPKEPYGGQRFLSWDWIELSAVTIPANASANIQTVKSLDEQQVRAASGAYGPQGVPRLTNPAGVTAKTVVNPKGTKVKTIKEQISSFEAKRAANVARRSEIMEKAGEEVRTLEGSEKEEYDNLSAEVKEIDEHLVRLKDHEGQLIEKAAPVTSQAGTESESSKATRQGTVTWGKSSLPPGIRFTRYAMCVASAKGNLMQAEVLSRRFNDTSPEVGMAIKAAVAAGTTQDATWAAPLVQLQEMQSEFVDFLRPMTLLGRIPNIRRVPFNIKFTRQTAGTTGTFVGEGLPKPLGKMDFELLSLTWAKAATIIVMTDELVRFSNPGAETLARDDLAAGIARYLDLRFIDPVYAGVANVSPASITNGITPIASLGTTIANITDTAGLALQAMAAANLDLGNLVWLMNPATAIDLSLKRTTQDILAFPTVTATGGTFLGYPVITSNNVALSGSPTESFVVLLDPTNIMLADDGGVSIDMSNEASLQMDGAPTNPATSTVNLWQSNMVALRAERYINWRRRRETAVQVITMNQKW